MKTINCVPSLIQRSRLFKRSGKQFKRTGKHLVHDGHGIEHSMANLPLNGCKWLHKSPFSCGPEED